MLAYACMDSLAGAPHLGGQLGAELAGALCAAGWVVPGSAPRRLTVTAAGQRALREQQIDV
jgi:hypothetical protein